jgi:hypothetical protein
MRWDHGGRRPERGHSCSPSTCHARVQARRTQEANRLPKAVAKTAHVCPCENVGAAALPGSRLTVQTSASRRVSRVREGTIVAIQEHMIAASHSTRTNVKRQIGGTPSMGLLTRSDGGDVRSQSQWCGFVRCLRLPHWNVSSSTVERFDQPLAAFHRHAEIASSFRATGFSVNHSMPVQHTEVSP